MCRSHQNARSPRPGVGDVGPASAQAALVAPADVIPRDHLLRWNLGLGNLTCIQNMEYIYICDVIYHSIIDCNVI